MVTDVLIVGAGPVGCFIGKILAEYGLKVAIVEEHAEVGKPVCCTGIVGLSGLRELGIKPGKWVLDRLKGAKVYPPSNNPIELTRGKVEALVIDRQKFDSSLADAAVKSGADLFLNTRCVDFDFKNMPVVKTQCGDKLEARVVVGADGPLSVVARKSGLLVSRRYIKCAQVEAEADVDKGFAEIYLNKSFSPGFFGWMVKAGKVARIGIGTNIGNPVRLLESFLSEHPVVSRKVGEVILSRCTGVIPECLPRRTQKGMVLLVGDAAGQVKPLTGGGIYIGLSCAKIAAETLMNTLESGRMGDLKKYPVEVMKKFGSEFSLGIRAKKLFDQMSNEDLDFLSTFLMEDRVREIVLGNFDFDHHENLITALVANTPEILRSIGIKRALKYIKFLTCS
ncbi:MAG: geranylgeranyl reductase family protein [Candidatus Hadarchaeaceae archaeon]